jgi:hypothetical protein
MNTFVSAFLNLREDRSKDKSIQTCFSHFEKLASTGINIHLFLSKSFQDISLPQSKTIFVEYIELEDLITYKEASNLEFKMPLSSTPDHDSKNFMILMNAKIELVKRAIDSNVFNSTHFAWIDFSINHVFKRGETLDYLGMLGKTRFTKKFMTLPGCYPQKQFYSENIFQSVHWRFCGGFFFGDKESLNKFSDIYRANFKNTVQQKKMLVWEVNMWSHFELTTDWNPTWFPGDHNDTIVRIPSEFFDIVVSLTSIPPRFADSCKKTIDSLMNQVDQIYLNVPKAYKRFGDFTIPNYLSEEPYKSKVTLVRLDRDFGPATKYVGALDKINPDTWVFVCDDDQEYSQNIISTMFRSVNNIGIYQNHYEHIKVKTSGGLIHGYVGLMIHSSLFKGLAQFPLPESAYFVDDQWMSIFCFLNQIPIFPTQLEYYHDIFKVLQNNHEKLGICSLSEINNRDQKVSELSKAFNIKFDKHNVMRA